MPASRIDRDHLAPGAIACGRGFRAIDEYLSRAAFPGAGEGFVGPGEGNPIRDQGGDVDSLFGERGECGCEGSTARTQNPDFVDHDRGQVDFRRLRESRLQDQGSARLDGVQRQ